MLKFASYFKNSYHKRYEEVLFPKHHLSHLPWEKYDWDTETQGVASLQNFEVTVQTLHHVTHNKEFDEIYDSKRKVYWLRSNQKTGKSGYQQPLQDGSPFGHSFTANFNEEPNKMSGPYTYINPEEPILPGSYIWWGVSIDEIHVPYVPPGYIASPPFKKPHDSPYGNNMIYGSLKDALVSYQESFQPNPLHPRIELRFGGTLRYKFEVCHVVIVCAVYDGEDPPLSREDYPMWEGEDKIKFDPYTNKVKRVDEIKINIRNGIKWRADKKCGVSWDQIVFAFHFKDTTQPMICQGFNHREVGHSKCTKTRHIFNPNSGKTEWKCPNDCPN